MNRTVSTHGHCVTRVKKEPYFRSHRQLDVPFVEMASCSRLQTGIPWECNLEYWKSVYLLQNLGLERIKSFRTGNCVFYLFHFSHHYVEIFFFRGSIIFCDGKTRRNYISFCEKTHNFLPFLKEEILQHVSCSIISTFSLSLEFLSLQTTDFIFFKGGRGGGNEWILLFLQAKGPLFFAKVGICVTDFKYLPISLNKQLLYAFSLRMAGNLSGVNQINHTHGSCLFWGRLNVQCRRFELGTGKIHWERLTLIRFLLQVVTGLFVFLSKQGYWSTDSLTSRQQIGWHLQSTAKDYRVFWNKMQFN